MFNHSKKMEQQIEIDFTSDWPARMMTATFLGCIQSLLDDSHASFFFFPVLSFVPRLAIIAVNTDVATIYCDNSLRQKWSGYETIFSWSHNFMGMVIE